MGELLGFTNEVSESIKRNRYKFHTIEDSYYSARHLLKEFGKEDAEELVSFAEEVIIFVEARKSRKSFWLESLILSRFSSA